jgi:hypothetical protein
LFNLRVTLRATGVQPIVSLLPETTQPNLLARVQPVGRRPVDPADRALADAIAHRRIPRPARPAPPTLVAGLRAAARAEQVWLAMLDPAQLRTLREFVHDTRRHDAPDQTGRTHRDTSADGEQLSGTGDAPYPQIAVIGSFDDRPLAHLHAGQATQRIVLTAAASGVPAAHLPRLVEIPDTRRRLRQLIGGSLWPQAVLRFDHGPAYSGSTPPSAR